MTEPSATADPAGVERTADGTITDQTPTPPPTDTSTETTPPETPAPTSKGKTLLTEEGQEGKESGEKLAKTGAPDSYTDYTVPEGYELDAEVKKEADAIFKGMGLSQEQAQSLVDFYTKKTQETFQQPYEAYKEMTDGWRKEAEDHPDLRGKLGPGKEVHVRIGRAFDALNDPKLVSDFKELMDLTGAGNHPAFIRALDKWAQMVTEGRHVAGNGPSPAGQSAPGQAPRTAAQALYPHLPSANR